MEVLWIGGAFAAFALAVQIVSILSVLPRLRRNRPATPPPEPAPSVSLLRPVRGHEFALERTLESGFLQEYPDYELLFCVDSPDDPVIPLLEKLIAKYPDVQAEILIGHDQTTGNPKLDNLLKGWRAARGEWVVMAASNIILPPDYFSQLLARWNARTGLVSSPAAGMGPENAGGALECAFLNAYQARWQLFADQLGLAYAQGKTLFWNKKILNDLGGPEVLGSEVAEDAASLKLVHKNGLHVRLAPRPFAHPVGARKLSQVWGRQVRWARIRRLAFPRLFWSEPLSGAALPISIIILGCLLAGWPLSLLPLYAGLWYGMEWALARWAGWPSGWRDIVMNPLRDALVPVIWLAALRGRDLVWQGQRISPATAPERQG